MSSRLLALAAGVAAVGALVASCATGDAQSVRYVDPMTCEVKNPTASDPQYDPQCILAAQQASKIAARESAKAAAASAAAAKKKER